VKPYYEDDWITLYNGDCREVLPLLDVRQGAAIITDPPYGVGATALWDGAGREFKGGEHRAPRYSTSMAGNDEVYDPRWLLDYKLPSLLFGANYYPEHLPRTSSWVVWDKRGSTRPGVQGLPSVAQADCELAWTNFGGPARVVTHQWMGIVRASERNEERFHVTQKPVALLRWILQKYTLPGQTIVDPYAGSCSTLRAAKDLGQRSVGIELDESMCERAIIRLQQEALPLDLHPVPKPRTHTQEGLL
jgi:DNA modification methylase